MAEMGQHGKGRDMSFRETIGMTRKSKILTVLLANVVLLAILSLALFFYLPGINSPERQERAEVAGKRIYEDDEGYITFFITFRFSDGSEREFDEGRDGVGDRKRGTIYKALQEGETGLLVYKENGRFLRFEKDAEYGGDILKSHQIPETRALTLLIGLIGGLLALLDILILFVAKTIKIVEQTVWATLVEKGRYIEQSGDNSYTIKYATFETEDKTRLTLVVPRRKLHDSLSENDSGLLTFKESKAHDSDILTGFDPAGDPPPPPPVTQPPAPPVAPVAPPPSAPAAAEPAERREGLPDWLYTAAAVLLGLLAMGLMVWVELPFYAFMALLLIALFLYSRPSRKRQKELYTMPLRREPGTIVEKGNKRGKNCLTVLLEDGTAKDVFVSPDAYVALMKGDAGVLVFKESRREVLFIGFEKTEND